MTIKNKKLTKDEEDFLKYYEKPEIIQELMQAKINYLQDKIGKLSKEELNNLEDILKNKDIDEYRQEIQFNKELHNLNIDNITKGYNKLLSENNLNNILPSIRIQYIRSWKQYISSGELEKANKIEKIIEKFDTILDTKQKRDQKKEVFTKIFAFFFFETIALFTIIILNGFNFAGFEIKDTTLQIISGVTITQVAAMLMFIVQNLYPKNSDLNDDELKNIKNLLNTQKD